MFGVGYSFSSRTAAGLMHAPGMMFPAKGCPGVTPAARHAADKPALGAYTVVLRPDRSPLRCASVGSRTDVVFASVVVPRWYIRYTYGAFDSGRKCLKCSGPPKLNP